MKAMDLADKINGNDMGGAEDIVVALADETFDK